MTGCRLLSLAGWLLVLGRPAPGATIWQEIEGLRQETGALLQAGQPAAALGRCEAFIRAHAKSQGQDSMGEILGSTLEKGWPAPAERVAQAQRVMAAFEDVPYTYARAGQVCLSVWLAQRTPESLAALVEQARQTRERCGEQLPRPGYLFLHLHTFPMYALELLGRRDEALELALAGVRRSPILLADAKFLEVWAAMCRSAGRAEELLRLGKLCYVVCDYTDERIKAALDLVGAGLTATGGPGLALKFVKAQEDPSLANPLREVALPDLGPTDELLQAAGKDLQAQLLVDLCCGRLSEALGVARRQLLAAAGGDANKLAGPMRNVARCFKAHDLNLVRANRFLEYHRTGEGEDPLPGLEAELQAEAP